MAIPIAAQSNLAGDPTNPTLIATAAGAQATLATLNQMYDTATTITDGGPETYEVFAYVPEVFFKGKFGSFGIEAEIDYGFGKGKNATDGGEDLDASLLAYLAEASYDTGPIAFRGGYVYISGDENPYDDDLKCWAYVEPSGDLDKAFILTGIDGDARWAPDWKDRWARTPAPTVELGR